MKVYFDGMSAEDRARERRIERHAALAMAAVSTAEAKTHFDAMFAEVRLRSPEQVRRMEEAQGLTQ